MQGLHEVGSQEVEQGGEADHPREQIHLTGPGPAASDPAHGKAGVEGADRYHRAGHGDPVVLEEVHEVMVGGMQFVQRHAEVVTVVPEEHRPECDRRSAESGARHTEPDQQGPPPGGPAAGIAADLP